MTDWPQYYQDLIARLPDHVAAARMTLCGFSSCVDVYLALGDLEAVCETHRDDQAVALLAELTRRAVNGTGGEFAMNWPEGPAWLARHMTGKLALGGTSAQAAQLLATLGAPALLSLADRGPDQLSVIHPDILIATEDGPVPRAEIAATGGDAVPHYIFEFTAGQIVGGERLRRSSRVIVRFTDSSLQHDPAFDRHSVELAGAAGAGIICGFNELPPAEAAAEHAYATNIAAAWRGRGLGVIHLELGDFPEPAMRDQALADLVPAVTSFGLSLSELNGLVPGDEPFDRRALRFAEQSGLWRFCVHADEWAATITRGDPVVECEALAMGCLVAAVRAEAGEITVPRRLPTNATFGQPPLPAVSRIGDWSIACCPSPYLERPAATIGLGDTFLAGSLLVLGASVTGESVRRTIHDQPAMVP